MKNVLLFSKKVSSPYGNEAIINGSFDSDSDFNKSANNTITNGVANIISIAGEWSYFKQINDDIEALEGKEVIISIKINSINSGQIKISFSGGANTFIVPNSVGVHTSQLVNDGTVGEITIGRVSGVTDIVFDDLSVKEIL